MLPAASFAGMTNGKSEPGAQAVDGRLIQQRQQHQQQLAFFQGLHSFQASTSSAMGPQGGDVSGEMQRQQQLQQHFFYRQQPLYGNGNGQQYTHAQHPQALLHGRHQLHQEPSAQQQQWQNEAVSSPYSKDTFSAFSFTHRGQDGQPQAQQSQSQQHEQQHQAVLFHRYQQQLAAVAAAAASWAPYMMVQPASLSKESSLSGTMPPGGTTLHPGSFGSVSGAGTVANLLPPTTHPYAHSLASAYAPLALPVGAPWMTVWPPTVPSMGLSPAQLFLGGSANGSAGDHVRYHNGAPASKRPHVMSTGSNNADGGNGGSTEDSYRLVVDEAKRFVAHVARSRKTVDTVIPEQLGILSDLTSGELGKQHAQKPQKARRQEVWMLANSREHRRKWGGQIRVTRAGIGTLGPSSLFLVIALHPTAARWCTSRVPCVPCISVPVRYCGVRAPPFCASRTQSFRSLLAAGRPLPSSHADNSTPRRVLASTV